MTNKKIDELQMRAYQAIDEIEEGRNQSAKYKYLETITTIFFLVLDCLRVIRFLLCFVLGFGLYFSIKAILL